MEKKTKLLRKPLSVKVRVSFRPERLIKEMGKTPIMERKEVVTAFYLSQINN